MGNTFRRSERLRELEDAVERNPKDGTTNGICDESDAVCELRNAVPGIRDQPEDGVKVEGSFREPWNGGDGGREPATPQPQRSIGRGGRVPDRAAQERASALGAA